MTQHYVCEACGKRFEMTLGDNGTILRLVYCAECRQQDAPSQPKASHG